MTLDRIIQLVNEGKKIEAIKWVRQDGIQYVECEHGFTGAGHYIGYAPGAGRVLGDPYWCVGTGMSLKQAKDVVEVLAGITVPVSKGQHEKLYDAERQENAKVNELQRELARAKDDSEYYRNRVGDLYGEKQELVDANEKLTERIRELESWIVEVALGKRLIGEVRDVQP